MVPELSKAAMGLNPLIGTYAVDCDDEKNKHFCSQQVSVTKSGSACSTFFIDTLSAVVNLTDICLSIMA